MIAASHKTRTESLEVTELASLLSTTGSLRGQEFCSISLGLLTQYNKKLGFLNLFGDVLLYISMKMIIGQEVGRLRANKSVLLGDRYYDRANS